MASCTGLLLLVACAALLQVGCAARRAHHLKHPHPKSSRRNSEDASHSLGNVKGSNIITLPPLHIAGPDVIISFPDNCGRQGLALSGTELIVSNSGGGVPVDLVADDLNNPLSNVTIHCNWDSEEVRCFEGVDVTSYQYCGGPLLPPTTTPPTTTPPTTTTPTTTPPTTTPPTTTPPSSTTESTSTTTPSSSSSSSSSSSTSSSSSSSTSTED